MKNSFKFSILFAVSLLITNSFGLNGAVNLPETTDPKSFTVEILGEGTPVLYFPGFTVSGSIWKETIENLSLKGKSYLFSYAGFNGNIPIEMPWYSTIKNSIIEYIKVNNMSDIIIIGHSMGGNLALDIAAELPDRVAKIVVVESLPCMRELMMPGIPAESLSYDNPYNRQMLEMDDKQFENMATMMASNMTLKTDEIETLTNWILEADRKTYVYGYTDLLKLDLRDVLSKIKCKSLILGASFPDVKIAEAHYVNQYSNLNDKKIVMASNSKHFIMLDQPIWFYETVNEFLADEEK